MMSRLQIFLALIETPIALQDSIDNSAKSKLVHLHKHSFKIFTFFIHKNPTILTTTLYSVMFNLIITFCFSCILILSFLDLTIHAFSLSCFLSSHCSALVSWLGKSRVFSLLFHCLSMKLTMKKIAAVKNADEKQHLSLLGLPDSVLECILERLPPEGLYRMGGVSRSLREKCVSDYLWEKHMKQKWGGVISPAAYRKWACYIASQKEIAIDEAKKTKGSSHFFKNIWTLFRTRSMVDDNSHQLQGSLPVDSVMALYLSLQTGKFWFPAQVFNREVQYGHVGFMLSCYDAEVCYDSQTNTFRARFSALGGLTLEENIEWNRLRKPSIDTPSGLLHVSSCLTDLKPDDHIEIQWTKSKAFPYGWWYGVVGHLELCNGDAAYCQCYMNDKVVVEFTQYSPGSRWRQVVIDRKGHREVGNQIDGFYGRIRKLDHADEISKWKSLWPENTLDSLEGMEF